MTGRGWWTRWATTTVKMLQPAAVMLLWAFHHRVSADQYCPFEILQVIPPVDCSIGEYLFLKWYYEDTCDVNYLTMLTFGLFTFFSLNKWAVNAEETYFYWDLFACSHLFFATSLNPCPSNGQRCCVYLLVWYTVWPWWPTISDLLKSIKGHMSECTLLDI